MIIALLSQSLFRHALGRVEDEGSQDVSNSLYLPETQHRSERSNAEAACGLVRAAKCSGPYAFATTAFRTRVQCRQQRVLS